MLDVELYRSFSSYAYMLVYQLDAFVFNDRLLEFCSMGYDYIGSPMRRTDSWRDIGCSVGNGGFSLRKISSMLRVLRRKKEIFARRPEAWEENRFLPAEDLFFSFCATIPELDFHVPDFRTALEFAVGDDVNDIVYSATVMEIVSGRDAVACPDDLAYVPCEFADEEKAKIWIKIADIQEENELKAAMLKVRSTDANLKQVISNSQFHFGYVYLQEN